MSRSSRRKPGDRLRTAPEIARIVGAISPVAPDGLTQIFPKERLESPRLVDNIFFDFAREATTAGLAYSLKDIYYLILSEVLHHN